MSRLLNIGVSTLLSGGILSHGTLAGYVSDAARRALGMGLAHFKAGAVHYLGKDVDLLGRGLVQTVHQAAYGALRSYPRYLKYWEQTVRDKYLQTQSQTSLANKTGQYYRLIENQQAVARQKNHTDTIVGNIVADYLELGSAVTETVGGQAGPRVEFVDLGPRVQVSSKNNIVLTTVQGRDYTRKEFVSGGDYEISIEGKITSKYPDVYPEAEVAKFLKLMQHKGIIDCSNTILRQFKISQIIVLSYALGVSECRNVQPYTMQCVAVEPSEAVEINTAEQERVDEAIKHTNKWIKWVKMGTEVVDPSSLLKISRLWL